MSLLWLVDYLAAVLVLVVLGFLVVTTYNSVVVLRQQVAKAWANIDVALKQRHDELPNLVEAVRDVMAYERETLIRVTRLRAAYSPTDPIPSQAATSAATSVLRLQGEIERLEQVIADRRELYNDTVYRLNTRIRSFPTNLFGALFGWQPSPFFRAPEGAEAPPPVDLDGSAP